MPATSPSPQKRPSMAERSSSTHSLSSSGRPSNTNVNANKGHRVHLVNKHSRNVSHGKGLNKLGKVASTTNIVQEGRQQHQRKRSGPVTPTESPKTPVASNVKRNSSHAALSKNTSHANLRKNHSAGALSTKRNKSSSALLKLGAQPKQKTQDNGQKQGFFELGDEESSGDEDDEEEWEDSTTQSPELSRNQSKASTPLRPQTPNGEPQKPPDQSPMKLDRVAQLSETARNTATNRSAPNLRQTFSDNPPADPVLLQGRPRSSRAPPAMSTISAQVTPGTVRRTDSGRTISTVSQRDPTTPTLNNGTPGQGTTSSGSGGVSHFLQPSPVRTMGKSNDTGSEDDSSSEFMANYKPQTSDSPEKPRSMLNKLQSRAAPSRTNQKMELQRREMMRAGAAASTSPATGSIGLSAGSTVSLHNRSGSKAGNRNRSMAGEVKALKQDYEAAVKQLTVVRRFRNPALESLHRLQDTDALPSNMTNKTHSSTQPKSRPQSRRGFAAAAAAAASTAHTPKVGMARSPDDRKVSSGVSRSDSRARAGRVQFQLSRQGSHDDIGLTTSQDPPGEFEEEQDGMSPEEALIRRMWDSRVILENDGVQTAS